MRTTVDRFGRVVVPKAMRDRLGLRPGAAIEIEETAGHLSLRAVEDTSPLMMQKGVLVFTGAAVGDLEGAVAADREQRVHQLAGMRAR
ncbi:MAG: AbrB/MazE/SpoVT family DNA-binding domain-containing protein [Gemmatimonadaceae bacterium]